MRRTAAKEDPSPNDQHETKGILVNRRRLTQSLPPLGQPQRSCPSRIVFFPHIFTIHRSILSEIYNRYSTSNQRKIDDTMTNKL